MKNLKKKKPLKPDFKPEIKTLGKKEEPKIEEIGKFVYRVVQGYVAPGSSYKKPDNRDRKKLCKDLSAAEATLKSLEKKDF